MKNNSSSNIKLSYLFRDAGNYKTFGVIILRNASGKSPEEIDGDLRRLLIDGAYFYPEQVRLPGLDESDKRMWHKYKRVEGDEYRLKVRTLCAAGSGEEGMWHEYEKVEVTDKEVTDQRTVEEVIMLLAGGQVVG